MESTEVRRDLLGVIDVPDLTEEERQARIKPRKDKGTKLRILEDILEDKDKSEDRVKNETENHSGFH